MIRALISGLRDWRARRATKGRLRDARKARAAAELLLRDAERRQDTRDQGRFLMILRQATHEELQLSRSFGGVR